METRLNNQYNFLTEIDKLKKVQRLNVITDQSRRENSAEHSWHLAMLALILQEHAEEKVDVLKVVKMLLIHDIVEIDAGDAFLHTKEEQEAQYEKEIKAARRIFSLLPSPQGDEFLNCWEEFEEGKTAEAKFAKALDRVQPALLHEATDMVGWERNKITLDQINNRMFEVREHTPKLWPKVKSVSDRALS